jgi:hypothetical protein
VIGLVLLGVGMGAATIPATTGITEGLPRSQQGVGSALNDLSREVGGALGIAVVGSILAATYRSHLNLNPAVPPALADKARGSFAVAVHVGGPVQAAAQSAFVDGLRFAMLAAAGVALIGAGVNGLLLRSRRERSASVNDAADVSPRLAPVVAMTAWERYSSASVGTCSSCGGETVFHESNSPSPSYYRCEHCQAGWSRQNPCAQPASARQAALTVDCR